MSKSRLYIITGIFPAVLALASTACATKKYVRAQLAPVNTKIGAIETAAKEQADKEQADVVRVEAKIGATDGKVAEVAAAAERANASAAQANRLGQQNQAAIASNETAIAAGGSAIVANAAAIKDLEKATTYSLMATGEVTFGFNESNLDKAEHGRLDALVQQAHSAQRAEFELYGFTDPVGNPAYNLELSRRRAESVARYLVRAGMAVRGIHIVGFGKELVPPDLLADVQTVDPKAKDADSRRRARRVVIRIYTPNGRLPGATLTSSGE
jgi:outer membrane protein OmpA-like peptidoglycan-associated protein